MRNLAMSVCVIVVMVGQVNAGGCGDATVPTYSAGPASAAVTLVVWGDLQCPWCEKAMRVITDYRDSRDDDVRVVWRDLPLSMHKHAATAAAALRAAAIQGKAEPMMWSLMASRQELSVNRIEQIAAVVGLDVQRFQRDWKSAAVVGAVSADAAEAKRRGITSTPTIFANGRRVKATSVPVLAAAVQGLRDGGQAKAAQGVAVVRGKGCGEESACGCGSSCGCGDKADPPGAANVLPPAILDATTNERPADTVSAAVGLAAGTAALVVFMVFCGWLVVRMCVSIVCMTAKAREV